MTNINLWRKKTLKGCFSRNILTLWQPMRFFLGRFSRFSQCLKTVWIHVSNLPLYDSLKSLMYLPLTYSMCSRGAQQGVLYTEHLARHHCFNWWFCPCPSSLVELCAAYLSLRTSFMCCSRMLESWWDSSLTGSQLYWMRTWFTGLGCEQSLRIQYLVVSGNYLMKRRFQKCWHFFNPVFCHYMVRPF